MKIYIAYGLTHVSRKVFGEYVRFIHSLAAELTKKDPAHEVKYALLNSDPQLAEKPFDQRARLCYLWDKGMVDEADALIAEVSFPSTGVGVEIQIAESNAIPIILCFRDFDGNRADPIRYENPDHHMYDLQLGEGFVTLMALGVPSVFRAIRYEDTSDGIDQVVAAVNLLQKH